MFSFVRRKSLGLDNFDPELTNFPILPRLRRTVENGRYSDGRFSGAMGALLCRLPDAWGDGLRRSGCGQRIPPQDRIATVLYD